MKLNEIYLSENETSMLSEILEQTNKDLPHEDQKTFQQLAEDLLKDSIYHKWRMIKK